MPQQVQTDWNFLGETDSAHGLVNDLLDAGGVSFKSISWKTNNTFQPGLSTAAISLTLDLIENSEISEDTAIRLRDLCPDGCWPMILTGGPKELNPGVSHDTYQEILTEAFKTTVDPAIHSLRLSDDDNPDFNRALFSTALPIGKGRVVLGVVFSAKSEMRVEAAECLNELTALLSSNQTLISLLSQKCAGRQNPQTLINPDTKEVVWRNQTATNQWVSVKRFVSYLMNLRTAHGSTESATTEPSEVFTGSMTLALVTFLRPATSQSNQQDRFNGLSDNQETVTPLQYGTPTSVSARLAKTINIASPNQTGSNSEQPEPALARSVSQRIIAEKQDKVTPKKNISEATEKSDTKTITPTKNASRSKTALEIALSRLPHGGKLRLSKDDLTGEMFFESLDKSGEALVAISLQEPQEKTSETSE
jgi:hypothetical protein